MKLNCVIDTCSCLCLNFAEFHQKTLLKYLNDKAYLNYSHEVHAELRDHKSKGLPNFIVDDGRRVRPMKFNISEYEKRMLGRTLVSRAKGGNKGEVDNYIVSIDQVHQIKKNSIIFITDDKTALRGILSDWTLAFPTIKIWTSFDVILYLYAENAIPSKDIAIEMVQSIIAFLAPKPEERSEKTTTELITIRTNYTKRIESISKILK